MSKLTHIRKPQFEMTKPMSQNCYNSVASEMMLPEIHRAVLDSITAGNNVQSSDVTLPLKRALAQYTGVATANIAVATSAEEPIQALSRDSERNIKQVTIVGPISDSVQPVQDNNAKLIPSLINIKRSEIKSAIPKSTGILYLANPNALNGDVYNLKEIRHILESAGTSLVVIDESLFEYCKATCLSLLDTHDNLVIIRSMTKSFGIQQTPLVYALGAPATIAQLEATIAQVPQLTLSTAQCALSRQDIMRRAMDIVCENRVYLTALLRALRVTIIPTSIDVILVQVHEPKLALAPLAKYGVTTCVIERDGQEQTYLRIPIGAYSYCRSIVAAMTLSPREYYQVTSSTVEQQRGQTSIQDYKVRNQNNIFIDHNSRKHNSSINTTKEAQR